MNTRQVISETSGPVSLSASFNQDSTCFAVGTDTGFCSKFRSDHPLLYPHEFQFSILPLVTWKRLVVCKSSSNTICCTNLRRLQRWYWTCRDARSNELCCSCRRWQTTQVSTEQGNIQLSSP